MKNRLTLAILSAALLSTAVHAEDQAAAPAAPTPDWTFPGSVTIANDYIFRGLTQTNTEPALQAGIEIDHASGFYVGAWGSNINWLHDYVPAVSSSLEVDLYAGYRTKIADTIGLDVGLYEYYYPGDYPKNVGYKLPYTLEGYVALSYSFVSLKYSHTFTNLFGFANTKHSGYLDLSANYEFVPTWVLNAHIGRQKVNHFGAASYTDYKLGVTKNFDGGWALAVAWYDTNADKAVYTFPDGTFQGRSTGVASLTKTF